VSFRGNVANKEKNFFLFFFVQTKRKGKKSLSKKGQDATIEENHWRRRREQKIVLKAGIFLPCESTARYANVSFSGDGIKKQIFWFTAFPLFFFFKKKFFFF